MFEKKSEEYVKRWIVDEDKNALIQEAFKSGAEFSYNKANEWHYVKDKLPEMSKKWKICSDDILFVTVCDNKRHFGYFNSEKRFEEYGGLAHMFLPNMVKCFYYVPEVPKESE